MTFLAVGFLVVDLLTVVFLVVVGFLALAFEVGFLAVALLVVFRTGRLAVDRRGRERRTAGFQPSARSARNDAGIAGMTSTPSITASAAAFSWKVFNPVVVDVNVPRTIESRSAVPVAPSPLQDCPLDASTQVAWLSDQLRLSA